MAKPLLIILAALATWGAVPQPAPYEVGVVYWSMRIGGQVTMRRGVEQAASELSRRPGARPVRLQPTVGGEGEAGVARQIAAMARLVPARPDAIILQPIDSAALSGPVQQANAAGIPVVAYDQYVLKGRLTSFLTSDNELAGRLDGEYLANRFKGRTAANPMRLAIVEYPSVSSTVARVEGMREALDAARLPYRIVGRYEAVEPVAGRRVGQEILKRHPRGTLDAIFCVNDGGGLAVMEALERAGRKDVVMATIDGDPAAIAAIRRGGLIGIDTAQFCGPLGAESMRWTYRHLQGERVPRQVVMTVFPVTRENLGQYPGWMGPVPARITKPWPPYEPVPPTRLIW